MPSGPSITSQPIAVSITPDGLLEIVQHPTGMPGLQSPRARDRFKSTFFSFTTLLISMLLNTCCISDHLKELWKKNTVVRLLFHILTHLFWGGAQGVWFFLKPHHQVILIHSQLDENHFSVARVLHPGYTSESLGGALNVTCLRPIFRDADSPGVGCSLSTIASPVTWLYPGNENHC